MADEQVLTSGKSKYEISYDLMRTLLLASDGPRHEATRNEILEHYAKARSAVYGSGSSKF